MAVRRRPTASSETTEDTKTPLNVDSKPATRSTSNTGGWGAPATRRENVQTVQAPYLDLRSGSHIVKILNDAPTVFYLQHFVGKGKPPAICYRTKNVDRITTLYEEMISENPASKGCPLCDVGNNPSYGYLINVVDMSTDPTKVLKWTFGKTIKDNLVTHAENAITSPLNRETDENGKYRPLYWIIRQTSGSDGRRQVQINPLKQADLQDDYDMEPLSEEEVNELAEKSYHDEVLFILYPKKMHEQAAYWKANNSEDDD